MEHACFGPNPAIGVFQAQTVVPVHQMGVPSRLFGRVRLESVRLCLNVARAEYGDKHRHKAHQGHCPSLRLRLSAPESSPEFLERQRKLAGELPAEHWDDEDAGGL